MTTGKKGNTLSKKDRKKAKRELENHRAKLHDSAFAEKTIHQLLEDAEADPENSPEMLKRNGAILDAAEFLRDCNPEITRRARAIYFSAAIGHVENCESDGLPEADRTAMEMTFEMLNHI